MTTELLPAPLPDLAQSSLPPKEKRRHLIERVVHSVSAPASKRTYQTGVEQFFDWWGAAAAALAFSRNLIQRYRAALEMRGLAPRSINLRLAAVRKLAEEAGAEHLLPEGKVSEIQSVKGAKILGSPVGNWLNRGQTEHLLALPDTSTFKGKRDHALLVLLIGAGIRREELAALSRDQIQQRDGRWCLVDLIGKGGRLRTVAIPHWTKQAVDTWLEAMPIKHGPVLGRINKGGRFIGAGMSASSIYGMVLQYAARLGVKFTPHDLRRILSELRAYEASGAGRLSDLEQLEF